MAATNITRTMYIINEQLCFADAKIVLDQELRPKPLKGLYSLTLISFFLKNNFNSGIATSLK